MLGSIKRDPNVRNQMTKKLLNLRAKSITRPVVGALLGPWPRRLTALGLGPLDPFG